MNRSVMAISAIVIVALVAVLAYYALQTGTNTVIPASGNTSTAMGNLVFSLTDPPTVPSGTTSLVANYDGLQAHVSSATGASGWFNANASGSIDLMKLINVSQVIGNASIPQNGIVNMIRFDISSAYITINGTQYNVTVPSGQITAAVNSSTGINGTGRAIIDLTPTVVAIYTQNSTVFIMVPSVRAVVIGASNAHLRVGERTDVNATLRERLDGIRPNITVGSTTLQTANNSTAFSITVVNNGNRTAIIKHIMLQGNLSVSVSQETIRNMSTNREQDRMRNATGQVRPDLSGDVGANAMIGINGSISIQGGVGAGADVGQGNGSENGNMLISTQNISINKTLGEVVREVEGEGVHVMLNRNLTLNATANNTFERTLRVSVTARMMRSINFIVGNTTSLILPFDGSEFENTGFALAPGASATFTFDGSVVLGNGHLKLAPVSGNAYTVVVQGEEGARATANVTAS